MNHHNSQDQKTAKRQRDKAAAVARLSRITDNEETNEWKSGDRTAGKARYADDLKSRDDGLNNSTNVSEVLQAEKGRLATEQPELLYKTDF